MSLKITRYALDSKKRVDMRIGLVADLHARPCGEVLNALGRISPDVILCAGDIFEGFCEETEEKNKNGMEFFSQAVKIAPVYYCPGNHDLEKPLPESILNTLDEYGIHRLFDSYEEISNEIAVGGLLPAVHKNTPNLEFVREFEKYNGYKILLSHHPEYYPNYLRDSDVDIILSGHAHGGQWRLFGRGLYAPGQGLFPKYTSGVYDNKLIVSRGCSNHTRPIRLPRLFNPTEVVEIIINNGQ